MNIFDPEDTIAAISTAAGEGGIGIIRLSGPHALAKASLIFRKKSPNKDIESHRFYLGEILDPETNGIIDECLLVYMKAPRSFTREDVVELHCHGGTIVLQSVLELIMRAGVREAGPGEFTKRAFMNGRIDLSQAESVIDIIRAKTERGLRLAEAELKGGLKEALAPVKESLVNTLATLEAFIDFPEEDIDPHILSRINNNINEAIINLGKLLDSYEDGRILREGIHVVIAGKPNVGKSSLLNALLKERRAIVTSMPGTTRDIIEEIINIKGIPVKLIDTAGIRDTDDIAEKEGINRTREKLDEADLVLYMVDNSGLSGDDLIYFNNGRVEKTILLINKSDLLLKGKVPDFISNLPGVPFLTLSCTTGIGIEELKEKIYKTVLHHGPDASPTVVVSRKRHKVALASAQKLLNRALTGIDENNPLEITSIDIKGALDHISELTGETTPDDVLEKIFGEFCIGK